MNKCQYWPTKISPCVKVANTLVLQSNTLFQGRDLMLCDSCKILWLERKKFDMFISI